MSIIAKQRVLNGNHNFWKGGISDFNNSIRHCKKYRDWRTAIFKQDDYMCRLCGCKGGKLNADHYPQTFSSIVNIYSINTLDKAMNCDLLWDTDNGRTLCIECHKATPTYGKQVSRSTN